MEKGQKKTRETLKTPVFLDGGVWGRVGEGAGRKTDGRIEKMAKKAENK